MSVADNPKPVWKPPVWSCANCGRRCQTGWYTCEKCLKAAGFLADYRGEFGP